MQGSCVFSRKKEEYFQNGFNKRKMIVSPGDNRIVRNMLIILIIIALLPLWTRCKSLKEIRYVSSADNSKQPAMFYAPDTEETVPLIVALHTWSENYTQNYHKEIEQWYMKNGWAPGESPEVDEEYRDRSPLTNLANASSVVLHINAGIRDGHDGSHEVISEAAIAWIQAVHRDKQDK
jgi:hypothetical protein